MAIENGKKAPNILIVDDDAELCELVSEYLSARGLAVQAVGDGNAGLSLAQTQDFSLMVLDVMLPGLDGLEVLRRVRSSDSASLPVIMLTAHGDEVDRIVGLELGADDYLPKPFNPRELLARINAIMRRASLETSAVQRTPITLQKELSSDIPTSESTPVAAEEDKNIVRCGDLQLNSAARTVYRGAEEIDLTAVEFDLLFFLMREAGRVVRREELSQHVLQRKLLPFDRSLDMHISKLRRKIGPFAASAQTSAEIGKERIKTIRGIGYIFVLGGDAPIES